MHWTMSREDRERAVLALSQEYPKAFFSEPRKRVPLKCGIENDIKTNLKANGNSDLAFFDIDEAVTWYQKHIGYVQSCSTTGVIRIDLEGKPIGKITEAEAIQATQEATAIFREIANRKKLFAVQPSPAAAPTQVRSLSVNNSLSTADLLSEVQEQLATVKGILGQGTTNQFAIELIRPAVRLMIDELNTVIVRLDKGEDMRKST
jgi:sRNA-binding protein